MGDIVLSSALRSNLTSLQSTASLLSQTQERLSTGLRVNSAIDNPTSFFTAQGLNNRASDLSQLSDDIGIAVDTLKAADDGIKAITTLVENLKSTANEALTTKIKASLQPARTPRRSPARRRFPRSRASTTATASPFRWVRPLP